MRAQPSDPATIMARPRPGLAREMLGERPVAPVQRAQLVGIALACLGLSCLLTACGGSGATGPAALDLGLKALVPASSETWTIINPLDETAEVTFIAAEAPFAPAPGSLPTTVAPNGALDLEIVFAPTTSGVHTGRITLELRGAASSQQVSALFRAEAERVRWALDPPVLDFGAVPSGAPVERTLLLTNESALSLVTLSDLELPSPHLALTDDPFPLAVAPGGVLALTVRYDPPAAEVLSGDVRVGAGDLGGDVSVPLRGGSVGDGGEEILDFGTQVFAAGGLTPRLEVTLPPDAISLTLEAVGPEGSTYGLGELIGPSDRVYENVQRTGAYLWAPGGPAWAGSVPNTDRAPLQLVAGGGQYVFRIVRVTGAAADVRVRAIIERRAAGFEAFARLPLNVWLTPGLSVGASSAANDDRLQSTLAKIDQVLRQRGVRLGDITYYDVADSAFDRVDSESELEALFASTSTASEARLNLCFVDFLIQSNLVGIAGAIPGPVQNGTPTSGVAVRYRGFTANFTGRVAAHEIGHYCSLFHTVERLGEHDQIDDTAECPPQGTNEVCSSEGGGYLMHYVANGGELLSAGQAGVLRGHPHLAPGLPDAPPGGSKPTPHPFLKPWTDMDTFQARAAPEGWCGTCAWRDQALKSLPRSAPQSLRSAEGVEPPIPADVKRDR